MYIAKVRLDSIFHLYRPVCFGTIVHADVRDNVYIHNSVSITSNNMSLFTMVPVRYISAVLF